MLDAVLTVIFRFVNSIGYVWELLLPDFRHGPVSALVLLIHVRSFIDVLFLPMATQKPCPVILLWLLFGLQSECLAA